MSLIWQPPSAPAPAPTQPSPFRLAGPLLSRRPPFVAGSPLSPLSRDELGRAAYILRLEVPTVPPSPLMRLREIARRLAPAYFTVRDATDVATEDGNRLYIKYTAHVRLESPFGDPNVAVSADSREDARNLAGLLVLRGSLPWLWQARMSSPITSWDPTLPLLFPLLADESSLPAAFCPSAPAPLAGPTAYHLPEDRCGGIVRLAFAQAELVKRVTDLDAQLDATTGSKYRALCEVEARLTNRTPGFRRVPPPLNDVVDALVATFDDNVIVGTRARQYVELRAQLVGLLDEVARELQGAKDWAAQLRADRIAADQQAMQVDGAAAPPQPLPAPPGPNLVDLDAFVSAVDALLGNPRSLAPLSLDRIVDFPSTAPHTMRDDSAPFFASDAILLASGPGLTLSATPFTSLWAAPGVDWPRFWVAHLAYVATVADPQAKTTPIEHLAARDATRVYAEEWNRVAPGAERSDDTFLDDVGDGKAVTLGWTAAWNAGPSRQNQPRDHRPTRPQRDRPPSGTQGPHLQGDSRRPYDWDRRSQDSGRRSQDGDHRPQDWDRRRSRSPPPTRRSASPDPQPRQ